MSKVLRITAGRFHCWCDSNIGIVRKPNNAIPLFLWDAFYGKKPELKTIAKKEMTYRLKEQKLKWYQRLLIWIKKKLGLTPSTKLDN